MGWGGVGGADHDEKWRLAEQDNTRLTSDIVPQICGSDEVMLICKVSCCTGASYDMITAFINTQCAVTLCQWVV